MDDSVGLINWHLELGSIQAAMATSAERAAAPGNERAQRLAAAEAATAQAFQVVQQAAAAVQAAAATLRREMEVEHRD